MFVIGNEELAEKPKLRETILCNKCGLEHTVEYGEEVLKDGFKVPSKLLGFYKCSKKTYLAGVQI